MDSKEYFEAVAGQWDAMRSNLFSENVREIACDSADIKPGCLAADIGAGTGFITEGLVQRGARVIAVDQSPAMLAEIERKFGASGMVACRPGSADALPLESGAVDFCFANMYLHHVDDPQAAVSEMARILKPGGKLTITDMDAHSNEFLRAEQHDRWLGFARPDIRRWLEVNGLEEVVVKDLNET